MTMTGLFPTPSLPPVPEMRYREALEAVREKILAVPDAELAKVLIDIPNVVVMVAAHLPEILTYREEMLQKLPSFDIAILDGLEVLRLALAQTHLEYVLASAPDQNLPKIGDELLRIREILLTDFTAASKRGLISDAKISTLSGSVGYRNAAMDILAVCQHFRANWAALEGKTGTSLEELTRAEDLGQRMMDLLAAKERSNAAVGPALELRNRALTLFLQHYDEVRRQVVYLRWHFEDADRVAPSAYAGRNKRKSGKATGSDQNDDDAEGESTKAAGQTQASPQPATQGISGLPGSDPLG
jgi:hypothetical protein